MSVNHVDPGIDQEMSDCPRENLDVSSSNTFWAI
jgi:hypothetical protein